MEYNDHPLVVLAESMQRRIEEGCITFFKWTCLACGDRVTASNPDTITKLSYHDGCEACSFICAIHSEHADCAMAHPDRHACVTDTEKTGGNFLMIKQLGRSGDGFDLMLYPDPDPNQPIN